MARVCCEGMNHRGKQTRKPQSHRYNLFLPTALDIMSLEQALRLPKLAVIDANAVADLPPDEVRATLA